MPTSPITASFCRALNLGDDPLLYRTTDNPAHERVRAFLLADFSVRQIAPAVLTHAGFDRYARELRSVEPICDERTARQATLLTDNICEEVSARSLPRGIARDKALLAVAAAARCADAACEPPTGGATSDAGEAVGHAIQAGADAGEIIQQSISALYACAALALPHSETDHVD
jgi:hypothetical protein